ncbi:O-glycosyl hydrolase [Grosmannia clavigera kw1407]|uniref:Alpha-amylase n=1 Tax=Grosmannia clavigera (strain kw1407 / UAMH 11150) TaxID=655863 RepID=F0XAW7_GROCL|nr:O-glycosyl hydrolase [Grosmannia clavigera kw1407]EFX05166.1 O-glycosyl hydrolase [Grosmannia clavigera kw1407]
MLRHAGSPQSRPARPEATLENVASSLDSFGPIIAAVLLVACALALPCAHRAYPKRKRTATLYYDRQVGRRWSPTQAKFRHIRWSCIALWALLGQVALALTPVQWRGQSIYFLLTDRFARTDNSTTAACDTSKRAYCGGSWQGIINQLDYIQGMGFTAVWITPVTGQFYESTSDGTSYHGYWQQDIYDLNPNYGTGSDLLKLSKALHDRGMYLMVDVVANHMGYDGSDSSVDYSVFDPFNAASYFHPYCLISNYENQTEVEDCWLGDSSVSLPDLNTSQTAVQDIWYSWVSSLVTNYSVDGLRIDTVKHVQKSFWSGFNDAAGVYCVGEVFDGDPDYACAYQKYLDGLLNYPIYYPLISVFSGSGTSSSISSLYSMVASVAADCTDATLLGTFVENHDNPRFASYTTDYSLAKNALVFLFLSDGIPIVYAGQEQHYSGGADPANREATWLSGYNITAELYVFLRTTNKIRSLVATRDSAWTTAPNTPFYQDTTTLAMRKGSVSGSQVITIVSNLGQGGSSYSLTLNSTETGYTADASFVEAYSCASLAADSAGNVAVPMSSGLPRILVPASWISDSGLCGSSVLSATATNSASTKASSATSSSSTITTACTTATALPVIFKETVTTVYGENIFISGSISQLGNWNTANAVALSAANYTTANPLWFVTVTLPTGTAFEYKYMKVGSGGTVIWESDPNRSFTVSSSCVGTVVVDSSTWR